MGPPSGWPGFRSASGDKLGCRVVMGVGRREARRPVLRCGPSGS